MVTFLLFIILIPYLINVPASQIPTLIRRKNDLSGCLFDTTNKRCILYVKQIRTIGYS